MSHLEPKTFERILAVNLVANQRLIRSLDPLLRAAPAGRAVFVTDGGAGPGRAYWGGYAATKAALEALVLAYAAELRLTPGAGQPVRSGPDGDAAARAGLSRASGPARCPARRMRRRRCSTCCCRPVSATARSCGSSQSA